MCKKFFIGIVIFFSAAFVSICSGQAGFDIDKFDTDDGELEIWFIGHGTIMLKLDDLVIHVDPVTREADYKLLPDADIILITHSHGDHLDPEAVGYISKESTRIYCNEASSSKLIDPVIMRNGEKHKISDIDLVLEAVPAYNIVQERSPGNPFHPKGDGNGYIITIGGKRVYIGGDTEIIPEMEGFKNIDIAFLPMNLPYTMSPEMAAEAAKMINPAILYPYHFGSTDTGILVGLLKESGIDVRVRKL